MKRLSFSLVDLVYVSEAFAGGVMVQVSQAAAKTTRIGLETRIDPDADWCNVRSVMLNGPTTVFAIYEYAADQQFRLTVRAKVDAVTSEIVSASAPSSANAVSAADFQALSARVDDLADGQEPLILDVNEETGNLEQTGLTSGEFALDESGNLTFEEN